MHQQGLRLLLPLHPLAGGADYEPVYTLVLMDDLPLVQVLGYREVYPDNAVSIRALCCLTAIRSCI